jgi:hypothetical protein
MATNIKFYTQIEELEQSLPVVPASKFWPEWFKNQKPIITGNDKQYASTVRKCPAILDILSMGYVIPLWCDFKLVRKENDVMYAVPPEVDNLFGLTTHAEVQIDAYPFDKNTFKGSVKFYNPWEIVTPPGYSVMVVNPYYQPESCLKTLDGVIDTDVYHEAHINTFFTAPLGQEINLKRGMPLAQVIPFKREEYKMETAVGDHRSITNKLRKFVNACVFEGQKLYRTDLYTKRYK